MGGSDEDEGAGIGNDAAPWSELYVLLCPCVKTMQILCEDYEFLLIYILLCQNYMYCYVNLLDELYIKNKYIMYVTIFLS
jgi:hypothetical protein